MYDLLDAMETWFKISQRTRAEQEELEPGYHEHQLEQAREEAETALNKLIDARVAQALSKCK